MMEYTIRVLSTPAEMKAVEDVQRHVWAGDETEIVPAHVLLAAVHNGGLAIGAYPPASAEAGAAAPELAGFVFGFPGIDFSSGKPVPKHYSHMLAVLPNHRDQGLGFILKRAQWQMVRHQGLERINWTYDPLLSRNAHLNIARLGAVCNTYLRNEYGEMRDVLNAGDQSDRFFVDWWVNSRRVDRRLSRRARASLDLAHFLDAGTPILNRSHLGEDGLPLPDLNAHVPDQDVPLLLLEIPSDYLYLRSVQPALALEWRLHTRALFEGLFAQGYLVTDFIFMPGTYPRSFYVLSHGDKTLE